MAKRERKLGKWKSQRGARVTVIVRQTATPPPVSPFMFFPYSIPKTSDFLSFTSLGPIHFISIPIPIPIPLMAGGKCPPHRPEPSP